MYTSAKVASDLSDAIYGSIRKRGAIEYSENANVHMYDKLNAWDG